MADKEYIGRELATKILEEHMTKTAKARNKLMKSVYLMAKDHAIDYLNIMPTADVVEVRHGEWVEQLDGTHYCSECGHDATYTFDGTEICGIGCPFCYAKMDGKGE